LKAEKQDSFVFIVKGLKLKTNFHTLLKTRKSASRKFI